MFNIFEQKDMKKYYVYVRPGYIEYFDDLEEAEEFAKLFEGAIVKEC